MLRRMEYFQFPEATSGTESGRRISLCLGTLMPRPMSCLIVSARYPSVRAVTSTTFHFC